MLNELSYSIIKDKGLLLAFPEKLSLVQTIDQTLSTMAGIVPGPDHEIFTENENTTSLIQLSDQDDEATTEPVIPAIDDIGKGFLLILTLAISLVLVYFLGRYFQQRFGQFVQPMLRLCQIC